MTAAANRKAHMAADIEYMFGRGPEPINAEYGFSNGWYRAGDFNFCGEELAPTEHHPRHPADQGLND